MVKVKEPTEADIVFNRISVAHARSQRLLASLLPPPTESEKAQVEITPDEKPFDSVPELLGLGLAPPSSEDSALPKRPGSSLDILGQQLLGKKRAAELQKSKSKTGGPSVARLGFVVNADKSSGENRHDRGRGMAVQSSDSDSEGRAALVGSKKSAQGSKTSKKRKRGEVTIPASVPILDDDSQHDEKPVDEALVLADADIEGKQHSASEDAVAAHIPSTLPKAKVKSRSFLDEILAEKAGKRKKKKKKAGRAAEAELN